MYCMTGSSERTLLSSYKTLEMHAGGYGSEFEESNGKRKSSWRHDELSKKFKTAGPSHSSKLPSRSSYVDSYEKEEKKHHFAQFLSMSAYARHQKLVHDYLNYYGGKMEDFKRSSENDRTDHDILKENHRFVWDEDDAADTWGKRLAKRYYDKLFKEYCICDLSRYKENKVAMRWRIAKEVQDGKGQFICGSRKCDAIEGLKTWEVNFGYVEQEEKKNTLIKLRLCKSCSKKLNYHHKHKRVKKKKMKSAKKRKRKKEKKKKKYKKRYSSSESEGNSSDEDSQSEEEIKDEAVLSSDAEKEYDKEGSIWKKSVEVEIEKTREEEFDEYLQDLFM